MSRYPFMELESGQVQSSEFLIANIAKLENTISREELAQELDISSEDKVECIRSSLRAMERDGQLQELLRGTVIGHRDGFGFLRAEGIKYDYYISTSQMKKVIHGDVVIAQPQCGDRKVRCEARIVRILVPKSRNIVGRFFVDTSSAFVVPDDNRLTFDILIPPEATQGASMGFVVVVELTKRPTRSTKAIGKVVEVLGENRGTSIAVEIAVRTHDIPYVWPLEVKKQVAVLQEEVKEAAKRGRVDLRELPLVTIDSEDARDFDDAVYCEKKRGGGWHLWVAIADVSYYVRTDTPLDNEASSRATSVYFPYKVIPMLPEVLSNGLCSLNMQVDRLCLVCEMAISAQGRLSYYKFYEAVMNSHASLTYNKVWHILQGNQELRTNYAQLIKPLTQLYAMSQTREQARVKRGCIFLNTEEEKFILNAEHRIECIEPVIQNEANKLIEECMILANIAAARFVSKKKEPVLYRVHDRPSNDNITSLRAVLGKLGLKLGGGDNPEPNDYAEIINLVAGRLDEEMLQTMLLRSMKQAIYDVENRGHFGLALQAYTHFTSPIRRYPDILMHRAIKYLLIQNSEWSDSAKKTGGGHTDMEEMLKLGKQCSISERRADEATRDVAYWLKCDFMHSKIGSVFSGLIISVTGFGFFVRINKLFIDGLVHVSSLEKDSYRYDNVVQWLRGESSGQVYRLGDAVKIRVEAVHDRKIYFSLISIFHKVRGADKKERN